VGLSAVVLGSLLHGCYMMAARVDHLGVKAAPNPYAVPGSVAACVVTWPYVGLHGLVPDIVGEFVPSAFLQ
jgi:hypothetical protein